MSSPSDTILVIEDDMDTRDLLARILSAQGYGVRLAANGWEGLLAIESPPDLILLDMMMPGMDGASFLRSLRNTHRFDRVPVVVVTALNVDDVAEKVRPFGVERVISKGDDLLKQLKLAIRSTLRRPEREDRADLPEQGGGLHAYLETYLRMLAWS